jgi:hypothetical protein
MRWTRQRRLREADGRAGFWPVSDRRPRQTNGAEAYGQTVWSLAPVADVESAEGERGISRKTIAQGEARTKKHW